MSAETIPLHKDVPAGDKWDLTVLYTDNEQWEADLKKLPDLTKKVIALSGMAFKGQPETSDLRGSSSVYIAEKLKNLGYQMNLHDFVALPEDMQALNLGTYYTDLYEACRDASVLLVLNNHPKYGSVLEHEFFKKDGFEILDSWNVCTELHYSEGIRISTLGNMTEAS